MDGWTSPRRSEFRVQSFPARCSNPALGRARFAVTAISDVGTRSSASRNPQLSLMPITAILLAAGYATRLYPLTKDRPKALLPLGTGVILDEVLRSLNGVPGLVQRCLVTNRCFAAQFQRWQQECQVDIQIIDDGTETVETRLGAIRDLELARTKGQAHGDLLVIGTDNIFTWSLADFVRAARVHRPEPSIALWEAPSPDAATQFGVVIRNPRGRITRFVEKSAHPPSTQGALCVYYFPEPMCGTIRAFLQEGGNADAPGYFIQWLVQHGPVYGVMMRGAWYDIGTLETYQTVVEEWQGRRDDAVRDRAP